MFFQICVGCLCGVLSAAGALTPELEIQYNARFCKSSHAVLGDHPIEINPESGKQSLYAVFVEQMLAGYSFLPNIDRNQGGIELLHPEVLEHISRKHPFFSEDIKKCFERIADLLDQKLYKVLPAFGRPLEAQVVRTRIYPEGKTRLWRVIEKQDVKRWGIGDTVYIVLSQDRWALKGVLCDVKDIPRAQKRSVLDFKKRIEKLPPLIDGFDVGANSFLQLVAGADVAERETRFCSQGEAVVFPLALKTLERCSSGCGVGVVYSDPHDAPRGAVLEASSLVTVGKRYLGAACELCVTEFSYLWWRVFHGYILLNPVDAVIDADVFENPGVREAVCDRVSFFSQAFCDDLVSLTERMQIGCGKVLRDDRMTFEWTPVDKVDVCGLFAERTVPDRAQIFVLFQGKNIALHGNVVKKPEDSLMMEHPYSLSYYRSLFLMCRAYENALSNDRLWRVERVWEFSSDRRDWVCRRVERYCGPSAAQQPYVLRKKLKT